MCCGGSFPRCTSGEGDSGGATHACCDMSRVLDGGKRVCWSRRVPLVLQRRAVVCLIPTSLLAANSGSGRIGRNRARSRGDGGAQRFADGMRRFLVADGAGDSDTYRDCDRLLRSMRDKYDGARAQARQRVCVCEAVWGQAQSRRGQRRRSHQGRGRTGRSLGVRCAACGG